jgi:hypothetical protein
MCYLLVCKEESWCLMMVYALLIYSNNILYSVNFLEDMYIITGNLTWFLTFLELRNIVVYLWMER